jgi:hypothetical protein
MVLEIEYTTVAAELQSPKFSAMTIAFVGVEAAILGISIRGVSSVTDIYRQLRTLMSPPSALKNLDRVGRQGGLPTLRQTSLQTVIQVTVPDARFPSKHRSPRLGEHLVLRLV